MLDKDWINEQLTSILLLVYSTTRIFKTVKTVVSAKYFNLLQLSSKFNKFLQHFWSVKSIDSRLS